MTNSAKDKGDRAERAFVAYVQPHIPTLRRTKAGSEKDLGDVSGFRDRDGDEWCVQIADRKWRSHGEIEAKAREASEQALRLGASWWCLVAKRPGCSDVGDWFVWLTMGDLAALLLCKAFGMVPPGMNSPRLTCLTVTDFLALVAPTPDDVPTPPVAGRAGGRQGRGEDT